MAPPAPLVGFLPFASESMLLWGLAAVIPLAIHLLSRRTRQVTPWAAIVFLRAALRKNARRMRLEQWLLLALRTLVLLLLAVALAEPVLTWLPSLVASVRPGGPTHTLLVLDGSYSMTCRRGEQSPWEVARERARQLVVRAARGDGFSLLVMADPPRAIIADVAFAHDDVQQELDNLEPTDGGAALPATLDEVERILQAARARYPRIAQQRVCFFTDLGRTTWDDAISSSGRARFETLARDTTWTLIDVGGATAANLAITRLAARDNLPVVGERAEFEVEVRNFSDQDGMRQRVELLVDGSSVADRVLSLSAGGRATASFTHTWDSAGEHVVEARLADDALRLDNQRWLSYPVREALRVLCVEGEQDAARYLALALAPDGDAKSPVRPEVAAEQALIERELADYDSVWLCNVGRFSRAESDLLFRYVNGGGTLVTTLGDQTQADNYNQELGGERSGTRVIPARLEEVVRGGPAHFDPRDYQHPLLAPFRGHQRAGLLTVPVWRYVRLVAYEPETAETVLGFDTGDLAMVGEPRGQGRCFLLATALSLSSIDSTTQPPTAWTALPTWPCFPPLVQLTLRAASRDRLRGRTRLVGEAISTALPRATASAAVTVVSPAGRQERVPVRAEGFDRRVFYDGTLASGVYRVEIAENGSESQSFAINIDTRESDLSRIDSEALPAPFGEPAAMEVAAAATPATYARWPLFRAALAALLVLLLAESFLAWRFGGAAG